jgi:predicted ATPase
MITSIRLKNFKNFADETLRVGPFTILVGANASGKSNIRDAFRFLSGIGRGYTLAEIFGGKREAGWEPVRGAMNEIIRFGQEAFSVEVEMKLDGKEVCCTIEIGFDAGAFQVMQEQLKAGSGTVYEVFRDSRDPSHAQVFAGTAQAGKVHSLILPSEQPALSMFGALALRLREPAESANFSSGMLRASEISGAVTGELGRIRFLELSPERLREPAFPGATVLGDSGENLPVVLREICADPKRQETLASWIAELTPMDVTGFEFPVDPSGRVHLTLCEANGRKVSAYSASDGTLRFLAMLTVLLGENPPGLYFFEEIDTGIHPARQWLLLELIEKQAAKRGLQVVTTTHSPDLLTFVNDSTFEHLSVVGRLEDSQDAIIRTVAGLPNARKLRKSQGLGRLLTSAWMETALAFTEGNDEDKENEE